MLAAVLVAVLLIGGASGRHLGLLARDRRGARRRGGPLRGPQELPAGPADLVRQQSRPAQRGPAAARRPAPTSTTWPSRRSPSATAASFGKGIGNGTQTNLSYVPEQRTDFIFTAVGEQVGLVGSGLLLLLFAIVIWRTWRAATLSRDLVGTLICVGRAGHARVPGLREHRHDHGHHARRRHPAAAHELRGLGGDRHLRRHRAGRSTSACAASPDTALGCRAAGRRGRRRGPRYTGQGHDVAVAPDRADPRPRPEAGPLHRLRGRCRRAGLAGRQGRLAADLPRRLRDRPAQPGPADPLRADQRAPRRPGRALLRPVDRHGGGAAPAGPAAVLGRQPPAGRRVRPAGLQPVGRAGLHQPAQLRGPGRRAGPGGRARPRAPAGGGRRPLHLQPRAAGRLRGLLRHRRRRGSGRGNHRRRAGLEGRGAHARVPPAVAPRPGPAARACTCPPATTWPTTGPAWWR